MKFSEIMNNIVEVAVNGYVPFVRGLHGTGKSEGMLKAAGMISERLNKDVTFHTIDMSHVKEGELTGMPVTTKDEETGCIINTYTTYGLFNNVIKEAKEGYIPIIFFDEINRADRVVFNELMPIILNKRVQELELPEETIIMAAGNPEDITKYKGATDDYAVLPMDPALKDRFFIFELDVDPVEWLKWANEKDEETNKRHIHEDIIEYISEYPKMLHFLSNSEINPTPRAWKMFSDVYAGLLSHKSLEAVEDSVVTLGGGKIGTDTTINFLRFIKSNKNPLLKPQDFFGAKITEDKFKENLNKLASDTPTRQYISINNITEYYAKSLEGLKKPEKDKLVGKYCQILWKMPNDILIGSLKEMLENNKKALNEITRYDPKKITEVQKYLI